MKRLITAVWGAALLSATGCTTHHNFVMSDTAVLGSENHGMWTRPVELGYEIVGDVQGEADIRTVLGFTTGSQGGGGGGIPAIAQVLLLPLAVAGLMSDAPPKVSALAGNASYAAVESAGADALYVTRAEVTTKGFLFFYKHSHAVVYGKALKMQDFGVVEMTRADKLRIPRDAKIVIRAQGSVPEFKSLPGADDEVVPEEGGPE